MSKILHLNNRAALSIEGSDSLKFLQSLVTNDVNKLNKTPCIYAFMLNPQGRFLYDFFIYKIDDEVILDCQTSRKDEILKKFNMYKLRSNINITDKSSDLKIYYSASPVQKYSYTDPRSLSLGYRILSRDTYDDTIPYNEYDLMRMQELIPDADKDFIYEKSFVLEFDAIRLNALDFNKGCYIGQELVSRMNYRMNIRKKLYLIKYDNKAPLKGEEITIGERKIGIFLGSQDNLALGLLNIEEVNKLKNATFSTLPRTITIIRH